MKSKRFFTLIELLVVIAIIAILMAILLPAIARVRLKAQTTQARAQMKSIEIAVKSYETTYGLLPASTSDVDPSSSGDNNYGKLKIGPSESAYAKFFALLTCIEHPHINNITQSSSIKNVRQIRFLDTPDKYSSKGFVDPWGQAFVIFLDVNYVGYVKVGSEQVNRSIAIYSKGPDMDHGSSEKDADNIKSWSE